MIAFGFLKWILKSAQCATSTTLLQCHSAKHKNSEFLHINGTNLTQLRWVFWQVSPETSLYDPDGAFAWNPNSLTTFALLFVWDVRTLKCLWNSAASRSNTTFRNLKHQCDKCTNLIMCPFTSVANPSTRTDTTPSVDPGYGPAKDTCLNATIVRTGVTCSNLSVTLFTALCQISHGEFVLI